MATNTYWQIQCPARCAERSCPDHSDPSEWRKSNNLRANLSEEAALEKARAHAKECYKSGPYRLRKTIVSAAGQSKTTYIQIEEN